MKSVFSMFVTISLVVLTQSAPAPGFNYFFTSRHPSPYYRFPVYYHSPPPLPYHVNPFWRYPYTIIPGYIHNTKPSSKPVSPTVFVSQPKVRHEELSQEIMPEVKIEDIPQEILPEKEAEKLEGIPSDWLH